MRKQLTHLPEPVARTIIAFYRRKRFYGLLRSLLVPILCYAVLALVAMHLDRFLFLDLPARLWISGLTHGIALLVGVASAGYFLWRRMTVSGVAYELERMLPKETAERLVTLHDVLSGRTNVQGKDSTARAALVEQLIHETVTLCERTPKAGRLARDRQLGRRTVVAILLGLVWVGMFALPGYQSLLMLQRMTFPMRNLPKPSFVRLIVTPEAPVVGRGGEVVLQVKVEGEIPALLQRPLRWLGSDASVCLLASATGKVDRLAVTAEARPMSRPQRRRFVATLGDLQESFSYRVRCGDAQTDIRFAQVVAQPRVTGVSVRVEPPAYTGLEPVVLTEFAEPVAAFAGSRVMLSFSADQPLRSAQLVGVQDQKLIKALEPDPKTGSYVHSFEMGAPVEMEIVLTNKLGFRNAERVVVSLVVRGDQPPGVRLEYPVGEISAVQGELVPMNMELTDDLGLKEGAIGFQINADRNAGAAVREIPLPVEPKKLSQSMPAFFDLEKAGTAPGDEVLLWVRARDSADQDERSHTVRIHVTAFAGNENERRRLAALELVAKALTMVEIPAADSANLALNAASYEEELLKEAKAKDIALDSRPVPESLLSLLEREHHFTDSASAADEVRMLQDVVCVQLRPPASLPPQAAQLRKAAVRQLADNIIPSLVNERKARDLIRRAFNLRAETMAAVAPPRKGEVPNHAAFARRIDLLAEALDNTGGDVAALARLSPLVTKDVLACNRQVSRANRELKQAQASDRQQAIASNLCEQIDGWIEALLPPLPEWNARRLTARAALRAQYEGFCKTSQSSAAPLAADVRMVERSPFLGLGDRLTVLSPAKVSTNAATAYEAGLLRRMAVESEFSEWMVSPRVTPTERQLAEALRMLDLATNDTLRAAAAEQLRTVDVLQPPAGKTIAAIQAVAGGLYASLPAMADAVLAGAEPYDKAFENLTTKAGRLRDMLTPPSASASGGDEAAAPVAAPNMSGALAAAAPGFARWEADAMALTCRLHLDLTYGDPRREQTAAIAAVLPTLRDVLARYQGMVPPLLARMAQRAGRTSQGAAAVAATMEAEELARCVGAMESGMKRVMKQWRGEMPPVKESAVVREIRSYYTAARKMAEAPDPAAVAEAFFKEQPTAAALVLEQRLRRLPELQRQVKAAREMLGADAAAREAFLGTMRQSERIAGDIEQSTIRFAALDAGGTVRALATKTHDSIKAMIEREIDVGTLPRLKLELDDLRQRMEELKSRSDEVLAQYAAASSTGWRGGPAGIWDDASRRDAESARRRILTQFDRARRDTVLGFDAVLAQRGTAGAALPEAPLASSLFAWRLLHSTLGGNTTIGPERKIESGLTEQLVAWLLREIDETTKYLRRAETVRPYHEPTTRWTDSAKGLLRH